MQRWSVRIDPDGDRVCSECPTRFFAYRDRVFGRQPAVCSELCQRARKTRLQRARRRSGARQIASEGSKVVLSNQIPPGEGIKPLARRYRRRDGLMPPPQ